MRIIIRSRFGNVVLGFLGVLYFVSAGGTLVYYAATNWGANGLTDLILQAGLLAAVVVGVLFVLIAADNLGLLRRGAASRSRSHQTPAASRA